jgi:hypothetical protein
MCKIFRMTPTDSLSPLRNDDMPPGVDSFIGNRYCNFLADDIIDDSDDAVIVAFKIRGDKNILYTFKRRFCQ